MCSNVLYSISACTQAQPHIDVHSFVCWPGCGTAAYGQGAGHPGKRECTGRIADIVGFSPMLDGMLQAARYRAGCKGGARRLVCWSLLEAAQRGLLSSLLAHPCLCMPACLRHCAWPI